MEALSDHGSLTKVDLGLGQPFDKICLHQGNNCLP